MSGRGLQLQIQIGFQGLPGIHEALKLGGHNLEAPYSALVAGFLGLRIGQHSHRCGLAQAAFPFLFAVFAPQVKVAAIAFNRLVKGGLRRGAEQLTRDGGFDELKDPGQHGPFQTP